MNEQVAVVIVVRDGRERIARSLRALLALPEQPQVVVVDNDSRDGTAAFVLEHFPDERVRVVELARNQGAAGRNAGVAVLATPYVAFAEDDSWYEPGALERAVALFDAHPRVGLLNAHVLVGEDRHVEPLHADMVDTPVPDDPGLPGHRILSFMEGASIARRSAFCEVGGFDPKLGIGGPEEHFAADLLCCGWELRYVPQIVARHVPDHHAPSPRVRRLGLRNTIWFAWRRRPPRAALRWTRHVIADSPRDRTTLAAVAQALAGLPRVLRRRRPLPAPVELQIALLDEQKRRSPARTYGRRGTARAPGRLASPHPR
jgi:GT2 family glycosyltransferase